MVIKSDNIKGNIYFVLLGLLLSMVTAGAADAFYFRGYTYNETNVSLSNTNVRVESLKGTSNNAKTDAPGTIYRNMYSHFVRYTCSVKREDESSSSQFFIRQI